MSSILSQNLERICTNGNCYKGELTSVAFLKLVVSFGVCLLVLELNYLRTSIKVLDS